MLKAIEKILKPIVNTPIWKIVAPALIAAILTAFGGPIGVLIGAVIWAGVALYGISWFLLIVIGNLARSFAMSLSQARIFKINTIYTTINCHNHNPTNKAQGENFLLAHKFKI